MTDYVAQRVEGLLAELDERSVFFEPRDGVRIAATNLVHEVRQDTRLTVKTEWASQAQRLHETLSRARADAMEQPAEAQTAHLCGIYAFVANTALDLVDTLLTAARAEVPAEETHPFQTHPAEPAGVFCACSDPDCPTPDGQYTHGGQS
jgi:nucleoside phosphorylase